MPRSRQFRPKHRPPLRNKQHALDFLMAQTAAAAVAPRRFPPPPPLPPPQLQVLSNLPAPAPPINVPPSGPRKILINPHFRGVDMNSAPPNTNFPPFNLPSGPPPPFPSHPQPFSHPGIAPSFDVVPGQPQMQNFG